MPETGTLLLQNTLVHDPMGPFNHQHCDILVTGGKIEQIAKPNTLPSEGISQVVSGAMVSPGWVDLRAFLTDPGAEWKEDLKSFAKAAAAGGFTTVLAHSLTHPTTDKADLVEAVLARAATLPINLKVAGNVTAHHDGAEIAEMYDMHQAGAVAFSDGLQSLENAGLVLRSLQYLSSFDGLLMALPMDEGLASKSHVSEGVVATHLGLKGIPTIAESIRIERDLRLLEYFNPNCRLHLGPITTREGVQLIREAKKRFPNLTADTAALYLKYSDQVLEGFDANYKVWPPLRTEDDRIALLEGILDGTLDAVTSHHQPQALEDKVNDFVACEMGAAGLETAFSEFQSALTKLQTPNIEQNRSLEIALERLTAGPRKVLGLAPIHIAIGGGSELTVFDLNENWTLTAKNKQSKAVNYPQLGMELPCKVLGIYANGRWTARP